MFQAAGQETEKAMWNWNLLTSDWDTPLLTGAEALMGTDGAAASSLKHQYSGYFSINFYKCFVL